MSRGFGSVQKKILLLLAAGVSLACAPHPGTALSIVSRIGKEWEKINRDSLRRAIRQLYENKLLSTEENSDGTTTLALSDDGKKIAKRLTYRIDEIKIKTPEHWDKRWRMVIFDFPKALRKLSEVFRRHLCRLGFYSLQRSIFVYPYDCDDEINFLIEYYAVRKYVRQIIAMSIDNELHLKDEFRLE